WRIGGPGDHVAAGDDDVVSKADRESHRRKGLCHRTVWPFDRGATGGLTGRQHDDVVAGTHHTAGDRARVAAVVLMIASLRPDDVLHREPDVDQVTVGGDVDLF